MLGTDLLVGGTQNADVLAAALCTELDVQQTHIYQAKFFSWEQSPSPHDTSGSYFSDLGRCNTILIRELSGTGDIGFIVELEFLSPIAMRCFQKLADEHGLVVGLSRDTVFPEESGTISAEGYVLFRPGAAPRPAVVLEDQGQMPLMTWGVSDKPLPALPDILFPKD